MANKNQLPTVTNRPSEVGRFQGIGIPAKHGTRPGTFREKPNKDLRVSRATPPLKFN